MDEHFKTHSNLMDHIRNCIGDLTRLQTAISKQKNVYSSAGLTVEQAEPPLICETEAPRTSSKTQLPPVRLQQRTLNHLKHIEKRKTPHGRGPGGVTREQGWVSSWMAPGNTTCLSGTQPLHLWSERSNMTISKVPSGFHLTKFYSQ